jgi:hypothetical protein
MRPERDQVLVSCRTSKARNSFNWKSEQKTRTEVSIWGSSQLEHAAVSVHLLSHFAALQRVQKRAASSSGDGRRSRYRGIGSGMMWESMGVEVARAKEARRRHRGAVGRSRRYGGEMRGVIDRGEMRTLYLMMIHSDKGVVGIVVISWWSAF